MDYKNINDYEQIYLISENYDEAEEIIFKKYTPIVYSIAMKHFQLLSQKGIDLEDLVQEGFVGLSNAIKSFKEGQNALFYTFSVVCINRQINAYCRNFTSCKNEILNNAYSFDSSVDDENNYYDPSDDLFSLRNPDFYVSSSDLFRMIISFKHSLPFMQSLVFELRYNGFQYKEISQLLELSVSTIDHYIHISKNKLRLEFKKT